MDPTVYIAFLSHPARPGAAIGSPDEPRLPGAPLHLSLHTNDQDAADALSSAMRREWDAVYSYGRGAAASWDRAALSRTMVEDGYLAAMIERPVHLSTGEAPASHTTWCATNRYGGRGSDPCNCRPQPVEVTCPGGC